MKRFSPGANVKSDYYHVCDCCEVDDGRSVLVWENLPNGREYFALCFACVGKLWCDYVREDIKTEEQTIIVINRIAIPESLRNQIFEKDGYKCVRCGATDCLQLDHIIPFSKGGKTELGNLETLCKTCNLKKGTGHG